MQFKSSTSHSITPPHTHTLKALVELLPLMGLKSSLESLMKFVQTINSKMWRILVQVSTNFAEVNAIPWLIVENCVFSFTDMLLEYPFSWLVKTKIRQR